MCWNELSLIDERCPLINVEGGSSSSIEYNGVYLANKYNSAQYFKLGESGFFTLSKIFDETGKIESWVFRKGVSNYDFISTNNADYSISANPFPSGYGNSPLSISCTTLEEVDLLQSARERAVPPITTVTQLQPGPDKDSKKIFFDPSLDAPTITSKSIENALYQDDVEEIKITWSGIPNADEYRLEIYREERGKYNSVSHFTTENEFTYKPQGGNYFFKVNGVRNEGSGTFYGYDSNIFKFTKLYPGNCPEKDITIHFDHYENKHVYAKIDGVWYGTGDKYGEPVSMATFPCPITIDEFDYENDPNYMVVYLGRDRSRVLKSIDLNTREVDLKEIKELYSKQLINQSTVISSRRAFP